MFLQARRSDSSPSPATEPPASAWRSNAQARVRRPQSAPLSPPTQTPKPASDGDSTDSRLPHRQEMEALFGESFADVSVDLGQKEDLDALGANALTESRHIRFADAHPDRQLIAHELAHVVQNRRGSPAAAGFSARGDASEREADAAAANAASGRPVGPLTAAPTGAIQGDWKTNPDESDPYMLGVVQRAFKKNENATASNVTHADMVALGYKLWPGPLSAYPRNYTHPNTKNWVMIINDSRLRARQPAPPDPRDDKISALKEMKQQINLAETVLTQRRQAQDDVDRLLRAKQGDTPAGEEARKREKAYLDECVIVHDEMKQKLPQWRAEVASSAPDRMDQVKSVEGQVKTFENAVSDFKYHVFITEKFPNGPPPYRPPATK
jgi:hypothetical protein